MINQIIWFVKLTDFIDVKHVPTIEDKINMSESYKFQKYIQYIVKEQLQNHVICYNFYFGINDRHSFQLVLIKDIDQTI